MSIKDEITRAVFFTDYHCSEDARIEVSVIMHQGKPTATVTAPHYPNATCPGMEEIQEADVLRSYAHCLMAAADEMERMR